MNVYVPAKCEVRVALRVPELIRGSKNGVVPGYAHTPPPQKKIVCVFV